MFLKNYVSSIVKPTPMLTKNKCLNLQQNCSIGFDHFIDLYHFSKIIIDLGLGTWDLWQYGIQSNPQNVHFKC